MSEFYIMNNEKYTDIQLLELLRSEEEEDHNKAFIYLYKIYFEMVYAMIRLNYGYKREAEDIFQDAMVALYKNVRNGLFKGDAKISTYIYSIARFRWLKQLQKRRREVHFEDLSGMDYVQPDIVWEENVNLKETMTDLLDQLDEKCRMILRLFYFDKLSFATIAQKLEYANENSVKSQKLRCLRKMMKMIDKDPKIKTELEKCLN